MLQQLLSENDYLKELADLVQSRAENPGDQPGSAITRKVLEVLAELSRHRNEYFADKLELANMEWHARQIQVKILGLAGVENAEALGDSKLWGEDRAKTGAPGEIKARPCLNDQFIHCTNFYIFPILPSKFTRKGDCGSRRKRISATVRLSVRECAEKLLKEAFEEDSDLITCFSHPSSQSPVRGEDLFTLSFINQDGTIDHKLLIYYAELRLWGRQDNSNIGYRDLSKLIEETIVPEH